MKKRAPGYFTHENSLYRKKINKAEGRKLH